MDLGRKVVVIGGGFVAFDAARTALRAGLDTEPEIVPKRTPRQGSARFGARGDSRRRHRSHRRVARGLRRDAGAANHAGSRGVRRSETKACVITRYGRTASRHQSARGASNCGAFDRSSTRPAGLRRSTTTRSSICWRRTLHSGDRPEGGPVLSHGRRRRRGHAGGDDPDRSGHAGDVGRRHLRRRRRRLRPRNLIDAVANGKRAARSIHEHLAARMRGSRRISKSTLVSSRYRMAAGSSASTARRRRRSTSAAHRDHRSRDRLRRRGGARSGGALPVCHVQTIYDPERCVLCNRCVDVCPSCLAFVPLDAIDLDPRSARLSKPAPKPAAFRLPRSSKTTSAASAAGCAPSAARPRPSPWNVSPSPSDGCSWRQPRGGVVMSATTSRRSIGATFC